MTPNDPSQRKFAASVAIGRTVDLFVQRCHEATRILDAGDWDSFEEAFRLQQIAWANLDALIAKARLETFEGAPLVSDESVTLWIKTCKTASEILTDKIQLVMENSRQETIKSGVMRRNLRAFKTAAGDLNQSPHFLKRA